MRWNIVFGSSDLVDHSAVIELQRIIQEYQPYVVQMYAAERYSWDAESNHILIGTTRNNAYLKELADRGLIKPSGRPQGYSLACMDSPWHPKTRLIAIMGDDSQGVLYGVLDFNSRVLLPKIRTDEPNMQRSAFDKIPDYSSSDYPRIENRGIWTWGYVMYDYRRFLDNMMRLKMNMITIWNDCPPLNIQDVIEYARARGIRVILGFHWGWHHEDLDISNPVTWQQLKKDVFQNYTQNYAHLNIDGIYFQTLTEHAHTEIKNQSVASIVCKMVNEIAGDLYKENPDLYIQFGLHASSIGDRYEDLKGLDSRITIVWEDAGVLPYAYDPVTQADPENGEQTKIKTITDVSATIAYSKKLVDFCSNREFAMVPKGFICLRWGSEFEHHGPFIMGERSSRFIQRRLEERQARWDRVNSLWLKNFPDALAFYRNILECNPSKITVTGLIEDGMFEQKIQISVALFGEMLWNPLRNDNELLEATSHVCLTANRS
jgi:hypothetical protein